MPFYSFAPLVTAPSGAAGGDLTGTYPNPKVAGSSAASFTVTNQATFDTSVTCDGTVFINYGTDTNTGANVLAPAFANGVAAQLSDTSRDYMVYLEVGTAGTAFTVKIGPTSGVANTIVAAGTATSGEVITVRLPAGWFLQWSATTATLASQLAVSC